jgi:hypothetical protein
VPQLKQLFGTFNKLPKSESLVFTGTRKPEAPENKKLQSRNLMIKFQGEKFGFS